MLYRKSLQLLVLSGVLLSIATGISQAAPKLKIDNDHFDFGFTPEGQPVVHSYWAYNVGTDTLKIAHVRPSCGCTTVPLTKNNLAPGDSVALPLKFDTKRFKGQISKTAAVESNDTSQATATLYFTARVGLWEGIIVPKPSTAYLDTLGKVEQSFTLKNTSVAAYTISVLSPLADYLQLDLPSKEIAGKGEVAFTIRTTPKTPVGEYNTSVTLHFDGPEPHNITIPVYGTGYMQ